MPSTPPRARSAGVDAVRVIGILAVIVGHVWPDSEGVREAVYTWHVPLFFVLTGYFWSRDRSMRVEIVNRFRTIGRPYIAWLLLISAAFIPHLFLSQPIVTIRDIAAPFYGGTHIGRPYSAFWFMGALFAVAILYRLVQRLPLWAQWIMAGAGWALAPAISTYLKALPFGFGLALEGLVFVVAGATLQRVRPRLAHQAIIGLALLATSAVLIMLHLSSPVDLKGFDPGTPVLSVLIAIAISVALILLAESWGHLIGARVGSAITTLATGGTMVILTHAVVLWVLGTPSSGSWRDLMIAAVVPWVLALVLRTTRLSPWLLGVSQQKRFRSARRSEPTPASTPTTG